MANMEISPKGYHPSILSDNTQIHKYLCARCKYIMIDVSQSECGHRFCKLCIEHIKSNNEYCELCKDDPDAEEIDFASINIYPDRLIAKELDNQQVACNLCPHTCLLKEYKSHLLKCPGNITNSTCGNTGDESGAIKKIKLQFETALEKIYRDEKTRENAIIVLMRDIEKLSISTDFMQTTIKEFQDRIEFLENDNKTLKESINGTRNEIKIKDATIAEINIKMTALELTSYNGSFIWKIGDIAKLRQDAISGRTPSIYSIPFYTSKTGYKMCGRIYLNGDGMGKGSHVSLFFVIMRGHYDAMHSWPFKQKVTFIFLDQNGKEHVIDAFRPDGTSTSFKRPTTEMNIASGCPLFLPLVQLESPIHGYVKDNVAFIKIIVSLEDLVD